jgi:hypothetical protein
MIDDSSSLMKATKLFSAVEKPSGFGCIMHLYRQHGHAAQTAVELDATSSLTLNVREVVGAGPVEWRHCRGHSGNARAETHGFHSTSSCVVILRMDQHLMAHATRVRRGGA